MKLEAFARTILYGTTLEEKLIDSTAEDWVQADPSGSKETQSSAVQIPIFPGRPLCISKPGKAHFPSIHRMHSPSVRGEILHFFANHELLAMELMALILLRFPEAHPSFKIGIGKVIQEEQNHLKLYLGRMKELGVELGDLPVSDYFWNVMKGAQSPLEFITQMSLTFEQANLDYSLFFKNAVQQEGDHQTATILERVYQEEIGHVKHGLIWFNRWRESPPLETDWEAYLRILPPPMTPRRAKGFGYCTEGRRQAGLSETFIRELKLYTGSKGRPPVLWIFNPHCDAEIVRGTPGFTPPQGSKRVMQDIEALPLFLSLDKDIVLVETPPRSEWIESLQEIGIETPEFSTLDKVRAPKISGIQPWGWSPDILERFRPLIPRLVTQNQGNSQWCKSVLESKNFEQTGLAPLFSKEWSVAFLREWIENNPTSQMTLDHHHCVGAAYRTWESAKEQVTKLIASGKPTVVKAPYGTSGMQMRRIQKLEELKGPLEGWMKNILITQKALIIEEWLEKTADVSIQIEITEKQTQIFQVRRFMTGNQNEYRGAYLGSKLAGFSTDEIRVLHNLLPEWLRLIRALGIKLREKGYQGPAGIDALLWRSSEGTLKLKPLIELNPRWTMGRIALELEKQLLPGVSGVWVFIPLREVKKRGFQSFSSFAQELKQKYPLKMTRAGANLRIESGVVFTNDPEQAQEILTVMCTLPNAEIESFLL